MVAEQNNAAGCILIVDDDDLFRESLITNLSDAGFSTLAFSEGKSALRHLKDVGTPDVILLDWNMPGMTGMELLAALREEDLTTPVVFLTVLGDQIYEEAGLHGGATDFIEKSRGFPIILRRIDLILSGYKGSSARVRPRSETLGHGELKLHRDSKRVLWKGQDVCLTAAEFMIVDYLVSHAGRDVRYRELYDVVRGEGFIAGSGNIGYRVNVRTFIKRIRQKFHAVDPEFAQIENYLGFGYRWREVD
jgi:two-component system response regulator ChvI